jgi:hypothetical protein
MPIRYSHKTTIIPGLLAMHVNKESHSWTWGNALIGHLTLSSNGTRTYSHVLLGGASYRRTSRRQP